MTPVFYPAMEKVTGMPMGGGGWVGTCSTQGGKF